LSGRPACGGNSTTQRLREQNMRLNLNRILLSIFFLSLILYSDLYAVSLSTETVEKLKKEGKLEEWVKRATLAREKGVWQPNPNPPIKLGKGSALLPDTIKPIVICVDFSDKAHSHDTGEFSLLLFSKDFVFPTGSMRDFYLQNSYGKLDVVGGVTGWYTMPQLYSYYVWGLNGLYGPYPHNAQKLAEDAVNAADPYVNFADYDYNHDGWVDALIIVHAGPGAEETGSDNDIWSHKWSLPGIMTKDGVSMFTYNMDPEIQSGDLVHMGVFSHEFGHTLGLPDLYDTYYSSAGLGDWSIMAHGSWNNDGKTPAHFDAWCKKTLGWTNVNQLSSNQINVEIPQAETSPVSYRLWTSGTGGSQYFLVENRQKVGFDTYLPGEGLLIYHVDEGMSDNNGEWCPGDPATPHYKVALEQADGGFGLEGCYGSPNRGDGGDPFPGWWNKRAFDDTTIPSTRNYSGGQTQVAVWNISDSDSSMYANLDVTWSRPCLFLTNFALNDSPPGGNGNGRPEGGETVKIYFTISNIWLPITGTTVTGSVDTAGITFTDNSSYLGTIPTGGSANNDSNPMPFVVSPDFPGRPTLFTLHVVGNGDSYSLDFNKEVWAGKAEILIVDDDSGSASDYQSYYTSALDSLRQIYDIWDTQGKANPDLSFNRYKCLIWYTGDHKTDLFTPAQVESLKSFLDNGGGLFLTSQDAAEALSNSGDPADSIFLTDYLHCSLANGNCAPRLTLGEPGDPVGDTLYIQTWGGNSPNNQVSKDALLPDDLAITVLRYAGSNWTPFDSIAGIRYQGDYRAVFFGFGFEGMNRNGQLYQGHYLSKPHFVMQRVLNWLQGYTDVLDFEEEQANVPKSIELFQNYPNPFNPTTHIRFTVNRGKSPIHTSLKIYNICGQLVKTLLDEDKPGGDYDLLWNGRDEGGKTVSSGIYFYKLSVGSSSEVKKMVLLK
jgi:M6 family metalloprotease-like protein